MASRQVPQAGSSQSNVINSTIKVEMAEDTDTPRLAIQQVLFKNSSTVCSDGDNIKPESSTDSVQVTSVKVELDENGDPKNLVDPLQVKCLPVVKEELHNNAQPKTATNSQLVIFNRSDVGCSDEDATEPRPSGEIQQVRLAPSIEEAEEDDKSCSSLDSDLMLVDESDVGSDDGGKSETLLSSQQVSPAVACKDVTSNVDDLHFCHLTEPCPSDAPVVRHLKKKLVNHQKRVKKNNTKIKTLTQKIRRLEKAKTAIKDLLKQSKTKDYIHKMLNENTVATDLFDILSRKNKKKVVYSAALKRFCLTLNTHSSKAYEYVRNTFDVCLPHPQTLSKWYTQLRCDEGFTEEALQALE